VLSAPPLSATVTRKIDFEVIPVVGSAAIPEHAVPRPEEHHAVELPSYAHAADYSWLLGDLEYVEVRDAWRVRFAEAGDEDRYGGSVTLLSADLTAKCKTGQKVRIEGHLLDASSREPCPAYKVHKITACAVP
jgi:hypothetical protein